MKILHYIMGLPPVRIGGLTKYALDLAEGQKEQGQKVNIVIAGKLSVFNKNKIKISEKKWNGIPCYHIINPLPVSGGEGVSVTDNFCKRGDISVYINFLEKIQPDIIHIHSLMGLHLSFLEASAKLEIPIIYTTHDYFGLCPKATLLKENIQICGETDWSRCSQCIKLSASARKLWWKQSDLYGILKRNRLFHKLEYSQGLLPVKNFVRQGIRKKSTARSTGRGTDIRNENSGYLNMQKYYREMFSYISFYHFNSGQSREVYSSRLGLLNGKVQHITNKSIQDNRVFREYKGTLRISYMASEQEYKGFTILKEALDEVYHMGLRDFVCNVYCNLKDPDIPYIKRHKPYKAAELMKVYEDTDILIMPSIWKETFGMVALEALSCGVPILITDNVGAKDILYENMAMGIITAADKDSIREEIVKIYRNRDILKQMNKSICDWEHDFSFDSHVRDMSEMYQLVIGAGRKV